MLSLVLPLIVANSVDITIHRADGVPNVERLRPFDKNDLYVVLKKDAASDGSGDECMRTSVKENTNDPAWEETLSCGCVPPDTPLGIIVYESNSMNDDVLMGGTVRIFNDLLPKIDDATIDLFKGGTLTYSTTAPVACTLSSPPPLSPPPPPPPSPPPPPPPSPSPPPPSPHGDCAPYGKGVTSRCTGTTSLVVNNVFYSCCASLGKLCSGTVCPTHPPPPLPSPSPSPSPPPPPPPSPSPPPAGGDCSRDDGVTSRCVGTNHLVVNGVFYSCCASLGMMCPDNTCPTVPPPSPSPPPPLSPSAPPLSPPSSPSPLSPPPAPPPSAPHPQSLIPPSLVLPAETKEESISIGPIVGGIVGATVTLGILYLLSRVRFGYRAKTRGVELSPVIVEENAAASV